jgi:hypothetical protein
MPEEIEAPTEHLHETLHEEAHGHGGGHDPPPSWISQVALSAAVLAVLAAIASLHAGHNANEAMLEQMKATDQWALFQAKSIKLSLVETQSGILKALGKESMDGDPKELDNRKKKLEDDKKHAEEDAREEEKAAAEHMSHHVILARSVTIFQVAIALSAISALTRRKSLWFGSLVVGALGAFFLAQAFLS